MLLLVVIVVVAIIVLAVYVHKFYYTCAFVYATQQQQ